MVTFGPWRKRKTGPVLPRILHGPLALILSLSFLVKYKILSLNFLVKYKSVIPYRFPEKKNRPLFSISPMENTKTGIDEA